MQTLFEHYKHIFGKIETVLQWSIAFFLSTDCVWKQSKCDKNLVLHETGDPFLKPRSFSQPQVLFQQF